MFVLSASHPAVVSRARSLSGHLELARNSFRAPSLQQEAPKTPHGDISSFRASTVPPFEDAESVSRSFEILS